MEVWDVVALVLGSNLLIALATYFTTRMQLTNASKQFKIELGRAIDVENRKRKWEVRSTPLLKLRAELADVATKLDTLVADARRININFGGTKEEAEEKLEKSRKEYNEYVEKGTLGMTLFEQFDTDLVIRVEEIQTNYRQAFHEHTNYKMMDAESMKHAFKVHDENKRKIIEVQELINKKLEEL
jgi:hypothetical protein